MSKHTKGPWTVEKPYNAKMGYRINSATKIVAVTSTSSAGVKAVGPNCEANARLIAAAPELFGLLKTAIIYTSLPNHKGSIDKKGKADPLWKNTCACEVHEWFKAAFATIAKAEGDE